VWRWPPTPSNVEIKEREELHIYSPFGSSWSVPGWTVPLPALFCTALTQTAKSDNFDSWKVLHLYNKGKVEVSRDRPRWPKVKATDFLDVSALQGW